MKFILGEKLEMTQIWDGDRAVAVTKVKVAPCFVSHVKSSDSDGYSAVQICSGVKKAKNIAKPQIGHIKKVKIANEKISDGVKYFREFRLNNGEQYNLGDEINATIFEIGEKVDVIADSKGRGFQGVVKRHGFKGARATHGTKDQMRMPGSIGSTGPARVFKGMRMAGRMGGDRTTVKNTKIAGLDVDSNVVLIKGAVPGGRNSLVIIQSAKTAKK